MTNNITPTFWHKSFIAYLLLLCFTQGIVHAQLDSIPSPTGYKGNEKGYLGEPIEYNGHLYLRYEGDDDNFDLFKYDGSTLTEIPSPDGFQGKGKGYTGGAVVAGGKLCLRYQADDNTHYLFTYDGTSLNDVGLPANHNNPYRGYVSDEFVFNDTLFGVYLGNDGNYDLFKYDGTSLIEIASPTGFQGNLQGCTGDFFTFNGKLYMEFLGEDDNFKLFFLSADSLVEIPSPTGFTGYSKGYKGSPIELSGKLCLRYQGDDGNYDLFTWDGTSLTEYPSPSGFDDNGKGYVGEPLKAGSGLLLRYLGNDGNYDAVYFSGSRLTVLNSPSGYTGAGNGYVGEGFNVGSTAFIKMKGDNFVNALYRFNGSSLVQINQPANYDNTYCGYYGEPFIAGGKAYLLFRNNSDNLTLMILNGYTLTEVPSPAGFTGSLKGYNGGKEAFVGSNGAVFLNYWDNSRHFTLFKYQGDSLFQISNPGNYSGGNAGSLHTGYEYNGDFYFRYKNSTAYAYDLMKFIDCSGAFKTMDIASCGPYTSPSGKYIWSTDGTYQDTITAGKCDTLVTVNLEVLSTTVLDSSSINFDTLNTCLNYCNFSCKVSDNWENKKDDQVDWRINTGSTSSFGTGPSSDHTSASGNYLYLEANGYQTSCYQKTGVFQSKCIDLSNYSAASFSFWYHMYGSSMGALKVIVVQDGQETQIFSKSGNQGNQWLEFTYDLAPFLGGNVHVKFVGTTGRSSSGDMAIDDLYFTGTKLVTNTQKISPDLAQLFPNPASGSVTIKTNNGSLVQQVNISNSNGVLVKQINFPSSPIDIAELANGFYFVQVKMGEKSVTLKLIKH